MSYITQEQIIAIIENAIKEHCAGGDMWMCSMIAAKEIQSKFDSLPKSEPVAYRNELGEYFDAPVNDDVAHLMTALYLSPQPALSKEDMVKVLEALEVGPSVLHTLPKNESCKCSQCDFVRLRKEAITIMQSAIEGMK